MLALAAHPLGIQCRFLDPAPDAPAGDVGELIVGEFDDPTALDRFAHGLDAATFEFENVPVAAVEQVARTVTVSPSALALSVGQDRAREKALFQELGIGVPRYRLAATLEEYGRAAAEVGAPCVAKTRRMGYDGKGQHVLRSIAEADHAWRALGGAPAIFEAFVDFSFEFSVIGVRGVKGEIRTYAPIRNVHQGGILRTSTVPAPGLPQALGDAARVHVAAIMERLNYVGVLAVEFFAADGTLLANEMAPRVHNSGHWTIEGAVTSQFENHIRAVCGLPLGDTSSRGTSVMHNIVGDPLNAAVRLADPRAKLHWYGKEPRPGRKVGHVTIVTEGPTG
ncbi:MAG: 5-(carboxyamino)imidazole ribonucleotide synthase [Planctomycetes bacterium]|nr:5-(carboxyamino)imidazole ribonucleotide synthase [Planctomycetota bacterium]